MALVRAGPGIEDDDAVIEIAVGHEQLVGLFVDEEARRPADVLGVVAALVLARVADLHQELALAGELENLVVLLRAAAQPDVVLGVHEDPVLRVRPLIAGTGPAPGLKQLSARREFEHRRRRNAALGLRRRERGGLLAVGNTRLPVKHPDVVVRVDRDAAHRAGDPSIRQRLRPQRIRVEQRHLRPARLGVRGAHPGSCGSADGGERARHPHQSTTTSSSYAAPLRVSRLRRVCYPGFRVAVVSELLHGAGAASARLERRACFIIRLTQTRTVADRRAFGEALPENAIRDADRDGSSSMRLLREGQNERNSDTRNARLPGRSQAAPAPDDSLLVRQQGDLPARAGLERVGRLRQAALRRDR